MWIVCDVLEAELMELGLISGCYQLVSVDWESGWYIALEYC